ncbi:MAG: HD domain-containing protein [Oscillatoriales cyanobacterium C42_A2020_001]|nr:HD domain-containing protein [Leptolyngbyaceae cyanobacterium C42_A2020_001]
MSNPLNDQSQTRLAQQIQFIVEIDKLKGILRQTLLTDCSRRENSAEHSWHIAFMAILLAEYAPVPIDVLRVVKMLLIHDLVEIDAGDTFCYDLQQNQSKVERETQAADRLFGLLPANQGAELRSLWEEFEAQSTPEAQFAASLDRLQPMLNNYHTEGGTWKLHGITRDRVLQRATPIAAGAPPLWDFVQQLIDDSVAAGYLGEWVMGNRG